MKQLLFLLAFCSSAWGAGIVPQQIILYKNAHTPLPQNIQSQWLAPDDAYSALTVPANFEFLHAQGAHAVYALARIVWIANSPTTMNGVGIFSCPSQPHAGTGLVGCDYMTYFSGNDAGSAENMPGCTSNPGGPMSCWQNITDVLNSYIDASAPDRYFVGVAYGSGTQGPIIYAIEMFIYWSVP